MAEHMHLLARTGNEKLSGDGTQMSRADVERHLNGTPYRDDLGLWSVVEGKVPRAYKVVPGGWVALTRCPGVTQEDCLKMLTSVAVFGDLRHAKANGLLPDDTEEADHG